MDHLTKEKCRKMATDRLQWELPLKPDHFNTPGGADSQKNWVGVCGPLPKTLTLFMTKTCDIPYPIYDQTFKSKPCF